MNIHQPTLNPPQWCTGYAVDVAEVQGGVDNMQGEFGAYEGKHEWRSVFPQVSTRGGAAGACSDGGHTHSGVVPASKSIRLVV